MTGASAARYSGYFPPASGTSGSVELSRSHPPWRELPELTKSTAQSAASNQLGQRQRHGTPAKFPAAISSGNASGLPCGFNAMTIAQWNNESAPARELPSDPADADDRAEADRMLRERDGLRRVAGQAGCGHQEQRVQPAALFRDGEFAIVPKVRNAVPI